MSPATPYVPAGFDLGELCDNPSPTGRICLQLVRDGLRAAVCQECRDLLGQLLASVGEPAGPTSVVWRDRP